MFYFKKPKKNIRKITQKNYQFSYAFLHDFEFQNVSKTPPESSQKPLKNASKKSNEKMSKEWLHRNLSSIEREARLRCISKSSGFSLNSLGFTKTSENPFKNRWNFVLILAPEILRKRYPKPSQNQSKRHPKINEKIYLILMDFGFHSGPKCLPKPSQNRAQNSWILVLGIILSSF